MYEPLKKSQKENQTNSFQNRSDTFNKKKASPVYSPALFTNVRFYHNPKGNSALARTHKFQIHTNHEQAEYQSGNAVQLYTANDQTYTGETIMWDDEDEKTDFWSTVDNGLTLAKQHLNNTIQAWQDEGDPNASLAQYAQRVLNILNSEELQIYPMRIKHTYGLSGYDEKAISLNIDMLMNKTEQMAKTLLHEAFHIIGGCWIVDPITNAHTPRDETRSTSKRISYLYDQLKEKTLESINADTFAQYVMQFNLQE